MTPHKALSSPAALSRAGLGELGVPIAVLVIVLIMITPVPGFLLDLLISANITVSVIVLLVAMYIRRPVEFSVFPTTLLLMTLFRLALNVSSSRAILLNGNMGTAAAGDVIEAFGSFVVGGNYVVGVVIFLVLIAIQYVVINHGAVRISEVTARFTLDAMPGKQMSIDSDLNAGLVDETEARRRRQQVSAEAEFYGAMDGATRFTQRDAVASILITIINIFAGFLIGVLQHGMDLRRALETYTVLTIGDGLVTVIPALVISISGGLIVTRASSDSRMGVDFSKQLFGDSQPLFLAGGALLALAAFPGLPKIPFLLLGGGVVYGGWRLRQKIAAAEIPSPSDTKAAPKENLEALLRVEPLAVEVGLGLVKLVEGGSNSQLLRRIAGIRRQLASELGYLLPPVRVADNLGLRAREYAISLKGAEIARYELQPGCELAIEPARAGPGQSDKPRIEGTPTREPAFGIPAVWIPSEMAETARRSGYTVVDAGGVLSTHLAEAIRRHAHELFTRQDAKRVLDRVSEEHPKVVEDLVPKLLPLATVQKVLQNLLKERVSIRDAVTVLESLGEAAGITRNPILLTEYVRQAIGRMVVKPYLSPSGELPAFFLDPSLEQAVESAIEHGEHASHLNLAPQKMREILERIGRATGAPEAPRVLLAGSGTRYFLRQMLEASHGNLFVLSHSEIPPGLKVSSLGMIA
ncbi:MAG: flagellar biosynthesis protein FlhA [Bryobacteraceae bacterium]